MLKRFAVHGWSHINFTTYVTFHNFVSFWPFFDLLLNHLYDPQSKNPFMSVMSMLLLFMTPSGWFLSLLQVGDLDFLINFDKPEVGHRCRRSS